MSAPAKSNRKLVVRLVSLVIFMASMSFAAVPLYDWFCRTTGFGGTTQVADEAKLAVLIIPVDDDNGEAAM